MPPKNPKKQVGKKRKKDSPPPDPDTDDSASGTELVQLHVDSYVVTRWWSDVDMMERLSRINKKDNRALNKVITTCDWDDDLVLSKDDFTLMEKFLALLKPIKKMADLLNGENYSTIHMVLPTVKDIKHHIDGFKKDKVIGDSAKHLSKEFDDYFR